jgi:hypothetical protein
MPSVCVIRAHERPMPTLVNKNHPALKHGGYAATAILPVENRADFEKLHQSLIAELAPVGALEDDIVATIARMVLAQAKCCDGVCRQSISDSWLGNLRECLAHLV